MPSSKELADGFSSTTVIGPSILISGKLSGDEDLTVRGRVEGTLHLTRTLVVETSGIVKADVSVKNAVVSGVVVGNIEASESVELTREGRMVGDIRSPRIIIVDGASFRGRVDMGNAEPAKNGEARSARPVVRAQVKAVASPPRPPAPTARPEAKKAEVRPAPSSVKLETRPAPPPPLAPAFAEAAKKKVLIKKKK